jgi:AcrR family transcriptional regulator
MRSLAAELGAGAMTLYSYVGGRDDLDALVVEAVLGDFRWQGRQADWETDVRAVAIAMWAVLQAHPNAIPLIVKRRGQHAAALEPAERLLDALARSGRSGEPLLGGFRAIQGYVLGFAQIRLAPSEDATVERVQDLSAEGFPRLVEAARTAGRIDLNSEFLSGLDVILAGLRPSSAVTPGDSDA